MNGNLSKDYRAASDQHQTTQRRSFLSHKILLKNKEIKVFPYRLLKPTATKAPFRDLGSPENGSLPSESEKATTKKETMGTLGQPAMEEKHHLWFNCYRQSKRKGRKTKGQNWTVHRPSRLEGFRGTYSTLSP